MQASREKDDASNGAVQPPSPLASSQEHVVEAQQQKETRKLTGVKVRFEQQLLLRVSCC